MIRQAILTKYLGPTDHRGSRVVARAQAGKVTVPWDYSIDTADNHAAAAKALCSKFDWPFDSFVQGGTDDGYAFAWLDTND